MEAIEKGTMTENLGIEYIPSAQGTVKAKMPVNHRTCQPFGALNGGASLALAEITAGHGSALLCADDEYPCGIQVSANHVSMAATGSEVFATATLIHRGRRTHVWNVDITAEDGRLVSTARVTNQIVKKRP